MVAFVRNASKIGQSHKRLTIVQGELTDEGSDYVSTDTSQPRDCQIVEGEHTEEDLSFTRIDYRSLSMA